jgi:Dyp-type peroxidase family
LEETVTKLRALVPALQRTSREPIDPTPWENHYKDSIHGMMLLAFDDRELLKLAKQNQWAQMSQANRSKPFRVKEDQWNQVSKGQKSQAFRQAEDIIKRWQDLTAIEFVEIGETIYNKDCDRKKHQKDERRPVEHFGFIDGISNPLFLEKDVSDAMKAERISKKQYDKYDPWAPLHIALVKDPLEKDGYGSYLAFLKLEQDVHAFNGLIKRLADELNIDQELAEAFVMGRFKDGTPVVRSAVDGMGAMNNFNYYYNKWDNDQEGTRCPLHAHIRKANRRDTYRNTRIVRRGITYDYANRKRGYEDGKLVFKDEPSKNAGLLFMSFQSNIENQFERIHEDWLHEDSPRQGVACDPIAGHGETQQHWWPGTWGGDPSASQPFPFGGVITEKGGEYFFAPSLPFLRSVDADYRARTASSFQRAKTRGKEGTRSKR